MVMQLTRVSVPSHWCCWTKTQAAVMMVRGPRWGYINQCHHENEEIKRIQLCINSYLVATSKTVHGEKYPVTTSKHFSEPI